MLQAQAQAQRPTIGRDLEFRWRLRVVEQVSTEDDRECSEEPRTVRVFGTLSIKKVQIGREMTKLQRTKRTSLLSLGAGASAAQDGGRARGAQALVRTELEFPTEIPTEPTPKFRTAALFSGVPRALSAVFFVSLGWDART